MSDDRLDRAKLWFYRTWATVGGGLILWGAWQVAGPTLLALFPPVLVAAVLVYLLNPAVTWIAGLGARRLTATLLLYVAGAALLYVAGRVVVPLVVGQLLAFADRLPEVAVHLQELVNGLLVRAGVDLRVTFDPHAAETRQALVDWLQGDRSSVDAIIANVSQVAGRLFDVVLLTLLGPVLAFYLLVDLPALGASARRWVPDAWRGEVLDVTRTVGIAVAGYLRGQATLCVIVGVLTTVGALVVGVPFFAVIGLVAAVTNIVPMVGPWAGGIFGAVVALTVGDGGGQAVAVVIVVIVVQQIDGHLLSPAIVGRAVSLHPVSVALTLVAAGAVAGLAGMVIAVPVVVTIKLVVKHLITTRTEWGRAVVRADAG